MADQLHPAASGHLPAFIRAPGETDYLMIACGVFLVLFVLMVGLLYFRLHALPDHWAHKKIQLEIVCVLGLIAMFTHMHIFWVAGLLLALIDFPDFSTPLRRIAGSTEKIVSIRKNAVIRGVPADDRTTAVPNTTHLAGQERTSTSTAAIPAEHPHHHAAASTIALRGVN
jgi:hypothetical protein